VNRHPGCIFGNSQRDRGLSPQNNSFPEIGRRTLGSNPPLPPLRDRAAARRHKAETNKSGTIPPARDPIRACGVSPRRARPSNASWRKYRPACLRIGWNVRRPKRNHFSHRFSRMDTASRHRQFLCRHHPVRI
jgi:hypothetical protein